MRTLESAAHAGSTKTHVVAHQAMGESPMKVLFDNESFSFETLRTTGFASGTPTKFQFQ